MGKKLVSREQQNKKKKEDNRKQALIGIGAIAGVFILVIAVVLVFMNASKPKTENTTNTETVAVVSETEKDNTIITEYENGDIEYRLKDYNDEKADIVVGDNFFDTQIADFNLNFSKYEGKTVEIEGFNLYNFYNYVGRYSTSNLCPDCPTGYSYFEFEWNGADDFNPSEMESETKWLKVIGEFKSGSDEAGEYRYIDVHSVKVSDEMGVTMVSN